MIKRPEVLQLVDRQLLDDSFHGLVDVNEQSLLIFVFFLHLKVGFGKSNSSQDLLLADFLHCQAQAVALLLGVNNNHIEVTVDSTGIALVDLALFFRLLVLELLVRQLLSVRFLDHNCLVCNWLDLLVVVIEYVIAVVLKHHRSLGDVIITFAI